MSDFIKKSLSVSKRIPGKYLLLLLDLHTDFSGGRSGDLLFPSLEEFFTVYYDPHRQRL